MEELEELDFEIRPATIDDFDILTDINRICFPEQLRWKAFESHSRKWWNLLINSDYCEVFVCSIYDQVIGYTVLAYDRIKYQDAWEKHRPGLINILYLFATCPVKSLKRTGTKLSVREIFKKHFSDKKPWIEAITILPSIRRKVITKNIFEYCFKKLRILGHNSVYTFIIQNDTESKELFKKEGFVIIDEAENFLFYKKDLLMNKT